MTPDENAVLADAQMAYHRVLERIKDPERRFRLSRIGLIGLLDMHLETDYTAENAEVLR